MKYFKKLRSKILSSNIFKPKWLNPKAIYLMPYRNGSLYIVKWDSSYTLMHLDAKGELIFTTGGRVNRETVEILAYDFIIRSDPQLFVAIALKDMLLSGMHPSVIYSFLETKGIACNKDSFNLLIPLEKDALMQCMKDYDLAINKLWLLEKLYLKKYHGMIKYIDESHLTLKNYIIEWESKEKENEIDEKVEEVACKIQKTLKDSNSYHEYKDQCLKANVPSDCVLCITALSKVYASAFVESNKLLKEYKSRPKDSDLMSILHTTEKGIVGLKIKFNKNEDKSDYNITVGSAFIKHDDITGTKGLQI